MFQHMGEESELVPSGTVFTQGCTMRSRHCQNWTISQWLEDGEVYTCRNLAAAVKNLRNSGCRNINLVGGELTPWIKQWLQTFKDVNFNAPIIWNSNFGSNNCAKRISDAPDYWDACIRNLFYGKKYGELLLRILVLPGHTRLLHETDSKLDLTEPWLESENKPDVSVSARVACV